MQGKPKGNWKDIRSPYFKVRDSLLDDPAFEALSNAEIGAYLKLECLASRQPERGVIKPNSANMLQNCCRNVAKMLKLDSRNVGKYLAKYDKLELIIFDPDTWEIDCIYFKLNQEPLTGAERTRLYREAKALRERHKECDDSVTEDVTQYSKVLEKHPSKDVLSNTNAFLDNKGGDISEEIALGAASLHQSPSPEEEKDKDTFNEKDEVPWEVDLVPPPSTEQAEVTHLENVIPMGKIAKYAMLISEIPGSSGIFWEVRDLIDGPHGHSTQFQI